MLIDRTHRSWALLTAILFAVATGMYVAYAGTWPGGASGRTWPGMLFGVASAALMLFAGVLSIRKQTIRARLGSLGWWMRGHVWLGLLSVPLVLYHAAFRWGGTLELLLWVTLAVVIVSGVVGLALQNVLPRMMKLQLPDEAIPDQLAETCRRLTLAADEQVTTLCTPAAVEAAISRRGARSREQGVAGAATSSQLAAEPHAWLAGFYIDSIRPFLSTGQSRDAPLGDAQQSQMLFDRIRSTLPDDCHAAVDSLEASCHDRRQLAQQERLYRLLHGWLRVHVPASVALLVFAVLHVVTALYY